MSGPLVWPENEAQCKSVFRILSNNGRKKILNIQQDTPPPPSSLS
jgi:hypothetical protein